VKVKSLNTVLFRNRSFLHLVLMHVETPIRYRH